ncbi:trypsin-like serine protease [Streptomyces sp. NRRL B-24484]|uniref:trypsin-like serine protease n=1 Tax=Streptomyces sp. NRRL B-24484 TaxID=1463833 RepID=UPI000693342A|nr:trypsin-like serine protease [Streptomyces sp. NRRL B-24484]
METFSYPDASRILAEQNLTLKAGDGNIRLADCASGTDLVHMLRMAALPAEICFKITGPSGYLALETPDVINIKGDSHTIKATLSAEGVTSSVDIRKSDWTPVGEGDDATGNKPSTLLELVATAGAAVQTPAPEFPAVGSLQVGPAGWTGSRGCTATLVDPQWVLTSVGCIIDPASANASLPILNQGTPPTKTTFTVGGHTLDVVEFGTQFDLGAVVARLASPVTDVAPVKISATAPASGETVKVAGFGRTAAAWGTGNGPRTTTQSVAAVGTGTVDLAPATGAAPVCAGDTGAPLINTGGAITGIVTRAWQGGCLGTAASETRTGAQAIRADILASWFQSVRASDPGWKSSVLTNGANGALYRAVRLPDGSTTDFTDIQASTGTTGGVKTFAEAGMGGNQTHIVALGNDGHLWHSVRTQTRPWPMAALPPASRTDLTGADRPLANITQVSAVSIGWNLHVVAVAGGKVYHTVRDANGTWSGWGDVQSAVGPLPTVTTTAIASVSGELQVVAVAGGKAYHTIRNSAGSWTAWGDVAQAAGSTGTITGVAMTGAGGDAHLAVLVNNGAQQFHTIRFANRTWQPFANLNGVWGALTATSISAAAVDTQVQFTVTTSDNRLLWTARKADATWAANAWMSLQGTAGTHNQSALTGFVG